MEKLITKTSGIQEPYNQEKIERSLAAIGASPQVISELIDAIKAELPRLHDTQQIFQFAKDFLKKKDIGLASRYNLKKALLAFGPAGYPFEKYIATIFAAQGYSTQTGQHQQGFCIDHEVDVIAIKDEESYMIECKFHNEQRYTSDVKIPLYVQARFEDIKKYIANQPKQQHKIHLPWLVTNTGFTSQAIAYAQCAGMRLLSWNYPEKNSLKDLIKKYHLHPITTLVSLHQEEKEILLKQGWVLCSDIEKHASTLPALGFSSDRIKTIREDARKTCSCSG